MKGLKHIREEHGYTQIRLARELGVSQPTIATWETGVGGPRADMLPGIADILHCTIDALYGRVEVPFTQYTPTQEEKPCTRTTETSTKTPASLRV